MAFDDQLVRYVRLPDADVAWTSTGTGPPLVMGGWWSSHLELDAEFDDFVGFVTRIAEHRTVIRYDPPGVGLSVSESGVPSDVGAHVRALEAVLDAAGARSADFFAVSSGCPVVVALAARDPARVETVTLYGGYLRGEDIASPADREGLIEVVRRYWGVSSRTLTDIFVPDATADEREVFARCQRRAATAERASATLRAVYALDAEEEAPRVRADTLVMHRRGDRAIPFVHGRHMAARLPDADFLPLDGANHFPWHGDAEGVLSGLLRHLGVAAEVALRRPRGSAIASLTPREREVLVLVGRGLTDAQIASELFLSIHTVHRHIANARAKLGVPSRAAAATMLARES